MPLKDNHSYKDHQFVQYMSLNHDNLVRFHPIKQFMGISNPTYLKDAS